MQNNKTRHLSLPKPKSHSKCIKDLHSIPEFKLVEKNAIDHFKNFKTFIIWMRQKEHRQPKKKRDI